MLLSLFAAALAHGPFATVGMSRTPPRDLGAGFTPFTGPLARAGWEFGDRWCHEVDVQWSSAAGSGAEGDIDFTAHFSTFGLGYRFQVDFLGKEGFTPTLGSGLHLGMADIEVTGASDASTAAASERVPFLEFYVVAGARYTMESGLNFRGEVAGSTYGGFLAVQPSLGVGYQF